MPTRTISTKFKIEGESEHREAVKRINSEYKLLSSEMAKTTSAFASNQNSVEALTAKGAVLEKQQKKQTEKTEEMRKALDNARKAQQDFAEKAADSGKTVEELKARMEDLKNAEGDTAKEQEELSKKLKEATELQEAAKRATSAAERAAGQWQLKLNYAEADLNKLNAEIQKNENLLKDARRSMEDSTDAVKEYGDSASDASGKSDLLGSLGESAIEKISGALTAGGIAGTLSVIAEKAVEVAVEFDNARQTIVQTTGASGKALRELEKNLANVASKAASDIGDIAAGLGGLNTRFDLTGEALEKNTALFEKFARANKLELGPSVEYVSDLIYAYGMTAEDIPQALDALTVAGQETGVNIENLAESLKESSLYAKEYGYSLYEMIAIFAAYDNAGVETNATQSAMTNAFEMLSETGMSFNTALRQIRDGTLSSKDALEIFTEEGSMFIDATARGTANVEELTEKLKNCEGSTESTAKAAETFGDKWKKFWNSIWWATDAAGSQYTGFYKIVTEGNEEIAESTEEPVRTISELGECLAELMLGYDGTSESLQEFIDYLKTGEGQMYSNVDGYDQLVTSLTDLKGELTALEAEYAAALQESSASVEQLTGRFNNLAEVTAMSVADMNAALDSQVAYMSTYSANMQAAAQKGVNDGLLKSLSDGSVESAEILAGIVTATDEEIAELNKKWEATKEGKETFAETLAEMQTDFDEKSAELKTKYDEAVEHFNQYSEAQANGIQTVRGVIDGALAEAAHLYSTYNQIGAGARSSFEAGFNGAAAQINPSAAERSAMARMEKSAASLQAPAAPTVNVTVQGDNNRDVLLDIRDAVSNPPVIDKSSFVDGIADDIDRKMGTKKAIEERSGL